MSILTTRVASSLAVNGIQVGPDLGLYVHIPFCQYRCSYCDFATFADQDEHMTAYVDALLREIELRTAAGGTRQASTLFFGGGTPSRLPVREIERILASLHTAFAFQPGAEITLEANPGTLDRAHLQALKAAGITRLSIGVQTLNDGILRSLHRIHDATQALETIASAHDAGFPSINADLIFGLPGQDRADWERTLQGVLLARPHHLSVYGLIVEPGTLLRRQVHRGTVRLPSEDEAAEMYERTCELLESSGYVQYEVSNWALPGHQSVHNQIYWLHEPYLGLGLSAHSYLDDVRFANVRGLQGYISRLQRHRLPTASSETIDADRARADAAMLGLRLTRGLHLPVFNERFGGDFYHDHQEAIERLTALGLLEYVDDHVRLSRRGYLLANQVWQEFI